jgi:glycosyltransferase involved in cell wall biosynthesis
VQRVQLDLTPWVRAPQSGIGRTAWRSFEAIRELLAPMQISVAGVSRSRRIPFELSAEIRPMGLLERGLGTPHTLHHAFEHRLAPLKRCKRLLSIHDLWTLRPGNPYQSKKFQQVQSPILKKAIERADWITTPLPSVLDELHERFPETRGRSSHVPWASTLNPNAAPISIARAGSQRPFILTVAVIENRKNLTQLARALQGNTGLDWLILGKQGFGGEMILSQIKQIFPALIHLTEVSEGELVWAYQNAAALVLPSLEEGFGLPVLESAQFGTRLLLSKISAFTDIADTSPNPTALFFDSEASLRELLFELSQERCKAPDSRPLAQAYTWQHTAGEFLRIYSKLE